MDDILNDPNQSKVEFVNPPESTSEGAANFNAAAARREFMVGGGTKKEIDPNAEYTKTVRTYVDSARKRYTKDEIYPSPQVKDKNGQLVDLVFQELKDLQDPKNLEAARETLTNFSEALCLTGWESTFRENNDILSDEQVKDFDTSILAESYREGDLATRVFMAACEKLFPDIATRFSSGISIQEALLESSKLLTSETTSDLGTGAESFAGIVDQLPRNVLDQDIRAQIVSIGARMGMAIMNPESKSVDLTAVPSDQNDAMVNAARSMYMLRLARPKPLDSMRPAAFKVAKERAANTTVR